MCRYLKSVDTFSAKYAWQVQKKKKMRGRQLMSYTLRDHVSVELSMGAIQNTCGRPKFL